ncbi:protein OSB1, mitochondrial [Melia azedarach]|uniref:Protein OSB1, mitochondrial n=1 Tax=Melia azedarach TaxID=155640 RepID=A0ACC1WV80_MELAZ|nr:protein OSB1, mitochondrial [Melia azedarach]
MITPRLRFLFGTVCRFSHLRLAPFSSSSFDHPRFSSFFSDEQLGGSAVYRRKLKLQRPTTIKWRPQLVNSVSFIGSVARPVEIYRNRIYDSGVYTLLEVENSTHPNRGFRILLEMWGDMAKSCQKHLKPNDFIYVSGHLQSYAKVDENGNLRLRYKVTVNDLNYVAKHGHALTFKKYEESKSKKGEAGMEKYENRFYLWHLYFTNPYEWWDNRKSKLNPRAPDFKHKDTGEALWLDPNDPPWIKKQLQLIDSKMAEQGLEDHWGSRSCVSTWVYDD